MFLFAKQMQSVASLKKQVTSREVGEVFDAFVATIKRMRALRLKQEQVSLKAQRNARLKFWSHWKTLAVDQLQLAPLETEIKSVVREKWLLKLSFASLQRYNQIRKGKKVMYQSIVQYHSEMIIEKTFRKLLDYTDHRLTQKDMKEEADLFYKRQ